MKKEQLSRNDSMSRTEPQTAVCCLNTSRYITPGLIGPRSGIPLIFKSVLDDVILVFNVPLKQQLQMRSK